MNPREIVSVINEILETTWTDDECLNGKIIEIAPEWRGHMKDLVKRYRDNGWEVERKVEIVSTFPKCPRIYAVFVNPSFSRAGRERFEAKYGK